MINRDMATYDFLTFGDKDAYGQPILSEQPKGTIKMAIHLTNQALSNNIKYNEATYIGLTQDLLVDETYVILYQGKQLKVLYVNAEGRYRQVFLKEI